MHKANVDHTISGQGTAVSTLDHSATTPMLCLILRKLYVYNLVIVKNKLCIMNILMALQWSDNIVHLINHVNYDFTDHTNMIEQTG